MHVDILIYLFITLIYYPCILCMHVHCTYVGITDPTSRQFYWRPYFIYTKLLFFYRLATSVIVMFAIAIFISYGLHCYVPVEVLWKGYILPKVDSTSSPVKVRCYEYVLRIALCLLTCEYFIINIESKTLL